MANSVKNERLSPVLFEYKSEIEDSGTRERMDSAHSFEQQILDSPFMTEKIVASSTVTTIYSIESERTSQNLDINKDKITECSDNSIPAISVTPCSLATLTSFPVTGPAINTSNCYSYLSISADPTSSSPSSLASSTPVSSGDSVLSSLLPQTSSTFPAVSRSLTDSHQQSSNSSSISKNIILTDVMSSCRDMDVSNLCNGNNVAVTISRHCLGLSDDGGAQDESSCVGYISSSDEDKKEESLGCDSRRLQGALAHQQKSGSGISDAVTKILDHVDWSQIPMANNGRQKVHVKRPMNAFMVWAQEARRKLSGQHRQVHNAELSKSLGKIWRGMSDEQKKPFIDRADQLRQKHKQEYPNYKYQPRRRKENIKTASGGKNAPSSSSPSSPPPPSSGPSSHIQAPPLPPSSSSAQQQQHHSAFVSLKSGLLSVSPLSPPNSPNPGGVGAAAVGAVVLRADDPSEPLTEQALVGDCLHMDIMEGIDRSELNRYLWPDHQQQLQQQQQTAVIYTSQQTTGCSSPGAASSPHLQPTPSPHAIGTHSPYRDAQPIMSTVISRPFGPPPLYTTPTYSTAVASPVVSTSSPDTGDTSISSSSSSPPPPPTELLELQPPRRDDTLPSLSTHKGVNPFLSNNLCYNYSYNPPYPYAPMWH